MPEYLKGRTVLRNRTCAYCGVELVRANTTKEHVIGRRFVPRGTLNGQWNLILRACVACNAKKAALEDDISAISMQPNIAGQFHGASDPALHDEAARKAEGSVSRRTGKAVGSSHETIRLQGSMGPMKMEFSLIAAPQVDEDRVAELAHLHVTAFMYWLTYDEVQRIGYFIQGGFLPLRLAMRDDWGNVLHRAFMKKVVIWDERLVGYTADGYFRMAIRRMKGSPCWSWALEWNRNLRVLGFFGEEGIVKNAASELPELEFQNLETSDGSLVRHRREEPLPEAEDELFK